MLDELALNFVNDFRLLTLRPIRQEQILNNPCISESIKKKMLIYNRKSYTYPLDPVEKIKHDEWCYPISPESLDVIFERRDELIHKDWHKIWEFGTFNDNNLHYIDKYFDSKYNWSLCSNTTIPLKFWMNNLDKCVWYELVLNPSIPFSFLMDHKDEIHMPIIGSNINTPMSYIKKNYKDLYKFNLIFHPYISVNFLYKYKDEPLILTNHLHKNSFLKPVPYPYFIKELSCLPPHIYQKPVFKSYMGYEYKKSLEHFESTKNA